MRYSYRKNLFRKYTKDLAPKETDREYLIKLFEVIEEQVKNSVDLDKVNTMVNGNDYFNNYYRQANKLLPLKARPLTEAWDSYNKYIGLLVSISKAKQTLLTDLDSLINFIDTV